MTTYERPECLDFLQFQDILKKMRSLDDKIIYTLNVNLPTESFQAQNDTGKACKELFEELGENFSKREQAIKNCMQFTSEKVKDLNNKLNNDSNNVGAIKELRKEQAKLRFLQTELGVEEVLQRRTKTVYYERCRSFYVPSNLNL